MGVDEEVTSDMAAAAAAASGEGPPAASAPLFLEPEGVGVMFAGEIRRRFYFETMFRIVGSMWYVVAWFSSASCRISTCVINAGLWDCCEICAFAPDAFVHAAHPFL